MPNDEEGTKDLVLEVAHNNPHIGGSVNPITGGSTNPAMGGSMNPHMGGSVCPGY